MKGEIPVYGLSIKQPSGFHMKTPVLGYRQENTSKFSPDCIVGQHLVNSMEI